MPLKSGYVAIVGKPNVGKSSVLNRLLGEDLSIVTPKPETTRNNILGTLTTEKGQVNFIDTPGVHIPHTLLGKHMVRQAKEALQAADLVLAVIVAKKKFDANDLALFDAVSAAAKPSILLINKVDLVSKAEVLPLIEKCSQMGIFKDYIPISAKCGDNMDVLSQKIFEFLPQGPKLFPDDYLTDKPQRFFISETIRKYVLEFTREEIPHSVAVLIDDMKTDPPRTRGPADAGKNITHIQATIFVERPSQKAIVIGKKGQMLKGVGEAARKDIEKQLGTKVFLQLWVKVYKNWRQDPRAVKMLGYSQ